jgi:hypothetical protein
VNPHWCSLLSSSLLLREELPRFLGRESNQRGFRAENRTSHSLRQASATPPPPPFPQKLLRITHLFYAALPYSTQHPPFLRITHLFYAEPPFLTPHPPFIRHAVPPFSTPHFYLVISLSYYINQAGKLRNLSPLTCRE